MNNRNEFSDENENESEINRVRIEDKTQKNS